MAIRSIETREVEGFIELINNLGDLKDKTIKKAIRAGVNAGLTPLVKAIRSSINAGKYEIDDKKQARRLVGKKLKRVRGGSYRGYAGFAGSKHIKATATTKAKAHARNIAGGKGSVGVGAQNIHWFVLGTKDEYIGPGGQKTEGRGVKPVLKDAVPNGAKKAAPLMLAAARRKIGQVLDREARKMKK